MNKDVMQIKECFAFEGEFLSLEPIDFGHINETFVVTHKIDDDKTIRYILQWINHTVFTQPEKVMSNIVKITKHIRQKIEVMGKNPDQNSLYIIPTKDDKAYVKAVSGVWRAYNFIEGATTYMLPESLEHIENAGFAFGEFQMMLNDFSVEELYYTIPDFHNTKKRFFAFKEIVEKDELGLCESVSDAVKFVLDREKDTYKLVDMQNAGELPLRVTHNDTKFNNVMIDDKTGKSRCIIDLDTVMPGLSLYDFGDSIRSSANSTEEDEQNLDLVYLDLDRFEAYTKGYLNATRSILTDNEIELLPFSAILITLELGTRFLKDHLEGDKYFRIHRPNHNLERALVQFKLVEDMEEKIDDMKKIVRKYI